MEIKNLEECKTYARQKLETLRKLFAKAAIGDFSEDVPLFEEDDEFAELYVGIETILEVVRQKMGDFENEVGQRQEAEQRLISKNKEQTLAQKAMLNVLDDLQKTKTMVEQDEAKYEALLSSIGDGVVAIDKSGKVIFMNEAAGNMLGWKITDVIGKPFFEAFRVEDDKGNVVPPENRPTYFAINTGKTTSSKDYFHVGKNNKKFAVQFTVSPILLGSKSIGAINVFRDITEEKRLDRAKSEFISIASHQLRTPVTATRWLAELFQESMDKLTPKEKQYLNDLASSINRLSKLVEDLLNVSRIESGTLKPEKMDMDISDFIEDFTKDIRPYAQLKKHKLEFKKDTKKGLRIDMDSKMLYNILQNLVSNAIDYSAEGSLVTIALSEEGGSAKIAVSNNGQYIPEEEQAKLFQKFYRGESTKKMKTEGTGLGLYVVKSSVESVGGRVGFISEKNRDTVFWFTIPLKK